MNGRMNDQWLNLTHRVVSIVMTTVIMNWHLFQASISIDDHTFLVYVYRLLHNNWHSIDLSMNLNTDLCYWQRQLMMLNRMWINAVWDCTFLKPNEFYRFIFQINFKYKNRKTNRKWMVRWYRKPNFAMNTIDFRCVGNLLLAKTMNLDWNNILMLAVMSMLSVNLDIHLILFVAHRCFRMDFSLIVMVFGFVDANDIDIVVAFCIYHVHRSLSNNSVWLLVTMMVHLLELVIYYQLGYNCHHVLL